MYELHRVGIRGIRFIASFATEQELYNYCKARRGWISRILPDGRITPDGTACVSVMVYPDGFETEVWYDEDLHAGRG